MLYITELFICFILYSFGGWILEVAYGYIETKKIVNRGFLIGPLCPIYGIGCVLIYLLLSKFSYNAFLLFFMSCLLCLALEYIVSFVLEKLFKARFWDYKNMKYNLNGRICLEMAIPFGILGLLDVYLFLPYTLKLIENLSHMWIYIIACIMLVLFLIDGLISIILITKFKKEELKSDVRDNTIEISDYVKKTLKAFPLKTKKEN